MSELPIETAVEIVSLLNGSALPEEIAAYLSGCGLGRPDVARDRRVAERLAALRP